MKYIILLALIASVLSAAVVRAETPPPVSPIYLPLIMPGAVQSQAFALTLVHQQYGWEITDFARVGNTLFASAHQPLILKSTDDGATWQTNLDAAPVPASVRALEVVSGTLIAGGYSDTLDGYRVLIRSTDRGATWTDTSDGTMLEVNELVQTAAGTVIAVGARQDNVAGGVWRSTNAGLTWQSSPTVFPDHSPFRAAVVAADGSILAISNPTVWRSTNDGLTWQPYSTITLDATGAVKTSTGSLLVIVDGGYEALYKSTDNGLTWTHPSTNTNVYDSLAEALPGTLYALREGPGTTQHLFTSTNEGTTWTVAAVLGYYAQFNVRHGLWLDPVTRRLFVGSSGCMIYRSNPL